MARPSSHNHQPHFPFQQKATTTTTTIPSKSHYRHFLCKSLLFIAFLIFLPLFPSKAPDFINQSILITKFWELIHLFFVGIVVSYGLFSRRRNVEFFDTENLSRFDDSLSHASRLFHVSSVFEGGFEISCGFNEKNMVRNSDQYLDGECDSMVGVCKGSSVFDELGEPRLFISEDGLKIQAGCGEQKVNQAWNSQYFHGESMVLAGNGRSVLVEMNDPRLFISENGLKIQAGFGEKKVNQPWNSQYFHGESMVLAGNERSVLNPKLFISEDGLKTQAGVVGEKKVNHDLGSQYFHGESMFVVGDGSSVLDKPLGLPIRSLRSRIVDSDSPDSVNGSRSGSGSKGHFKSYGKVRKREFGDLGPSNLEGKFEECVSLPSPIPWRSRSGRMEVREEVEKLTQIPHSMPLSAEEKPQFEPSKSRSFHSTRSFSSRASSMSSSSPEKVSHSSSVSSDRLSSKTEEMEKKTYLGSSKAVSPSLSSKLCLKDPLIPPTSRPFSIGSSCETFVQRSFENELKDFSGGKEHKLASKDRHQGHGSLHEDLKSATPLKASLRGKSVRTVRASEPRNLIDDKIDQNFNNFNKVESVPMMKNGTLHVKSSSATLNQEIFKYHKGEKQELGVDSVESDKDSGSEADNNFQVSSDKEESASFNSFGDVGSETYEVDKKAGEFIAKFREQIRLQRVESVNGSSGHWATYW